jgi:hypothetical protein
MPHLAKLDTFGKPQMLQDGICQKIAVHYFEIKIKILVQASKL